MGFVSSNGSLLFVRSLAIFAALSTLLGRIYFMTYYQALGIPTSEVRPNIVEYSLISPSTSIFGIGLAIAFALAIWWMDWWDDALSSPKWRKMRLVFGVLMFLAVLAMYAFDSRKLILAELGFLGVLAYTFLQLIVVTMNLAAGVLIVSALTANSPMSKITRDLKRMENSRDYNLEDLSDIKARLEDANTNLSPIGMFLPVLIVVFVCWAIFMAASHATRIAVIDAKNTLENSPTARIELSTSSATVKTLEGLEECQEEMENCRLKVVLITDRFVYAKSVVVGSQGDERLFSIPIRDVAGIVFLSTALDH